MLAVVIASHVMVVIHVIDSHWQLGKDLNRHTNSASARIQKGRTIIIKALSGNWQGEVLAKKWQFAS
jgi:hypothetical protein